MRILIGVRGRRLRLLRVEILTWRRKFPEKTEYWNTFKMYLASDWFKLWGYQCGADFKCWKFVLTHFPQFGKSQAKDTARCVMKLVRERKNQMRK
jgi:hypothetical protein